VPFDPGPDLVLEDLPIGALQFTMEVQSVLLELDDNKDAGPNGIPPLILKNCASVFTRPLFLLFNRSLSKCVFPVRWKLSYVPLIFKMSRRNNVEDYRGAGYIIYLQSRIVLNFIFFGFFSFRIGLKNYVGRLEEFDIC
jgi:hypothetical protein